MALQSHRAFLKQHLLQVVDSDNRLLGFFMPSTIHRSQIAHRVVSGIAYCREGKFLLCKNKRGKFDFTARGPCFYNLSREEIVEKLALDNLGVLPQSCEEVGKYQRHGKSVNIVTHFFALRYSVAFLHSMHNVDNFCLFEATELKNFCLHFPEDVDEELKEALAFVYTTGSTN